MRYSIAYSIVSFSAFLFTATASWATPLTSGGPGGVGDPNVTGDLRLWLRGDQGVHTLGGFVTQWDDQSAYGDHFIQTTVARRPAFGATQNGISVLGFTNSQAQFLNAPPAGFLLGGVPGSGATTFAVYTQNVGSTAAYDQNGLPFFARSTFYFGMHSNDNNPTTVTAYSVGSAAAATVNGVVGGGFPEGTWGTIQGIHGGAGGLNGITFTDLTVGWDVGGRYLDGSIGEIVFYNTTLNTAQQRLVQNHLSSKYDTALAPAIDHYDGDTLAKGNYDFGVFGVLNVSGVSVTNSGMDGFGIEATPGLNQGALAGYKVLNNSIIDASVNLAPHTYLNNMWERSWYVDSDESFGATLGFNSVDAGLASLDSSEEYFILFRDTEVGDWSVLGQGAVSGDLITFNVATLMSGYYTIAFNLSYVPEPNSLAILGLGCVCLARKTRRQRGQRA